VPADALQVLRTCRPDRPCERAAASSLIARSSCRSGPADGESDGDDCDQREWNEQRRFPHDAAAGGLRAQLECVHFGADLRIALLTHFGGEGCERVEAFGQIAQVRFAGVMDNTLEPDRSLLQAKLLECFACRGPRSTVSQLQACAVRLSSFWR